MAAPAFGSIGTQLQGTASTMNVPAPSGVAVGDILVVAAYINGAGTIVSGMPSGWAHAPDSPVGGPDNHSMAVMWKRADAGDTGASTFDFTLSVSEYRNAACTRYTGANTSGDPWDVTNSNGSNSLDTNSPPVSDTTTVADTLLIWSSTNWLGGAWTPPTSFTERRDTGDQVCTSADLVQSAAGATGSIVGVCAGSNKRTAWLGALEPVSVIADTSVYSPARLPGRIGPDGKVFLPNQRFDNNGAAAPIDVTADTAVLVLSGVDATLAGTGAGSVTPDIGTLVLSGVDATLAGTGASSVTADVGILTFTGADPILAGSGASSVAADVATLTFSAVDATLSSGGSIVTVDTATLTLSGVDLTLAGSGSTSTTADVAVLVLSGVDVTVTSGTTAIADVAVLTLSGVTPALAGTGTGGTTADPATLLLTGIEPALAGTGAISRTADVAVLVFSGVEVGAFSGQLVTPYTRTYYIPPDPRELEVPADNRTLTVPADARTFVVPGEEA